VSITATEHLLLTKDEYDVLTITNPEYLVSENRQELPATYRLDGCIIYLINAALFLRERSFFAGKLVGYEIEPWRAVDIDEPEDFVVGEFIFSHRDKILKKIAEFDNA
jgi:CMP-N-acetylneuraminic acid synthetase